MMLTSYVPVHFTRACPGKKFLITGHPPPMLMREGGVLLCIRTQRGE